MLFFWWAITVVAAPDKPRELAAYGVKHHE